MRLLDTAKRQGFPVPANRPEPRTGRCGGARDEDWQDTIYIGGFRAASSCSAVRRGKSSLIVPGDLLVTERVCGDALNVLNTVVSYWSP